MDNLINTIITNPLYCGVCAFIVTYVYLYWYNKREYKYTDSIEIHNSINIFIPLVISGVVVVIHYMYYENTPPYRMEILTITKLNPATKCNISNIPKYNDRRLADFQLP